VLEFEPELMTVASTPSAVIRPLLLPELITVAVPPAMVRAAMAVLLVPELIAVALPPPVVSETNTLAVPELVVVAFWFVPFAVLTNWDVTVPALLQLTSVAVVVQTNCAEAGERARSANAANAIAESVAASDRRHAWLRASRCPKMSLAVASRAHARRSPLHFQEFVFKRYHGPHPEAVAIAAQPISLLFNESAPSVE
jgi:hypothetical protein